LNDKIDVLKSMNISVKLDERNTHSPGFKFNEYELKGVPIRIAVGSRDIENKTVEIFRRDTSIKNIVSIDKLVEEIDSLLIDIQKNLLEKALKFRKENTFVTDDYEEFKKMISSGGFVLAHWDGSLDTEEKIKKETKATIRCIPEENFEEGKCIVSGKKSTKRVVFAKAY
jgi:prolyl-tRNA synthetase